MDVFVLDSSKLTEILYNMENQNKDAVIIISTGEVLSPQEGKEIDSDDTYPLPIWGPVEGFRIMNEFVSDLKNPLLKNELMKVLKSGNGVFRKFKNVLKDSPEVERIWFSYKKDEIKARIVTWYNQIREYAGLEVLSEENIEDDKDLLDFDFSIREAIPLDKEFIFLLDKKGFKELYSNYPPEVVNVIYGKKRMDLLNDSMFESDFIYIAENPLGESVGFVWASGYTISDSFSGLDLLQLYVIPEYRGLGMGKMLLDEILKKYKENDFNDLLVNCQGKNSWLINYLELEGYSIASQELSFRL